MKRFVSAFLTVLIIAACGAVGGYGGWAVAQRRRYEEIAQRCHRELELCSVELAGCESEYQRPVRCPPCEGTK